MAGGIEFASLTCNLANDVAMISDLRRSREVIVLFDADPDAYQKQLLLELNNSAGFLFFAVSGLERALASGAFIPSVCQINVFGGLPVVNSSAIQSPFDELTILEQAVENVPLGELPSIFFNHQRNQKST